MTADGGSAVLSSPATLMVPVGDGHTLHFEVTGPTDGIPALFLHGGPGSGCQPSHRQLFDSHFRAVFVDQRGAGLSTPKGEHRANTTAHLVADLERVRMHLGIDRWLVVGGSWGATLALAYAEAHPAQVAGLVLRSPFLGTRAELDWAFGTGLAAIRPELHADFLSLLTPAERANPIDAYFARILDPDPQRHAPAARAWHDTERILSEVEPSATRLDFAAIHGLDAPLPATPFMEAHYFSNDCFLEPGQLLAEIGRIADIPGVIVQGRYDLLCPPATATALAARWPACRVEMVEMAGHSLGHAAVATALRRAIAEVAAAGAT